MIFKKNDRSIKKSNKKKRVNRGQMMKRNKKYYLLIVHAFFIWPCLYSAQQNNNLERDNSLKKANLLIITTAYNHPEYIVWQDKCFKKYLEDKYEFIVLNDATDETIKQKIDDTCQSLHIRSIRVPQDNRPLGTVHTWASYRHGQAMDYGLQTIGFDHKGIVVIIDSDMFLINDFSIIDYLKGYDIAGVARGPDNNNQAYIWPGLIFFNMNDLADKKNISLASYDPSGFDTGGALSLYLNAHPNLKKRFFDHGRLRLYKNNTAVISLLSEPSRGYLLKCANCVDGIRKNQLSPETECIHKKELLKELGFKNNNIMEQKTIPLGAEFILGDTFFHIGGGSGYVHMPEFLKQYHHQRVGSFMNHILK